MRVRQHSYVLGRRIHCGAKDFPQLYVEWRALGKPGEPETETRGCVERAGLSVVEEPA